MTLLLTAIAALAGPRLLLEPAEPGTLYWGAWIGPQLTGAEAPWDFTAVSRFEKDSGRGVSLVSFASPFANCSQQPCAQYPFPAHLFSIIRKHGAIPFFSWASASLPVTPIEPGYQLQRIVAGRYDRYITAWARAARRWGHPFFLRFDWEMNSASFPWAANTNGNLAPVFVAAWRHVHRLFTRMRAHNVTWVWCPNASAAEAPSSLSALYPGDGFVDWTCLDGYNTGAPWRSFSEVFQADYAYITGQLAPSKPMVIAETASTEVGGSKSSWITDMFSSLAHFPAVHGLIWFDRSTGGDWPLETSASAQEAFRQGITTGPFISNQLAHLNTSPIPAL